MEEFHFYNLISLNDFEKFSTSEKIMWCLEKDIFYYAPKGVMNLNVFNCVDLNNLNLKQFDKEPFLINKSYKYKKDVITVNHLFKEEIFYKIRQYFVIRGVFTMQIEKIDLKLNLLYTTKKKIKYLISEINKLNILELISGENGYWIIQDKIKIGPQLEIDTMDETLELQLGWITGQYFEDYSDFQLEKNEFFKKFEKNYTKFLIYEYCIKKIEKLKQKTVNQPKTLTPLEQVCYIEYLREEVHNFVLLDYEKKLFYLSLIAKNINHKQQEKLKVLENLVNMNIEEFEKLQEIKTVYAKKLHSISESSERNLTGAISVFDAKIIQSGDNKKLNEEEKEFNLEAQKKVDKTKKAELKIKELIKSLG